jgi:hypothetical protein
MNKSALVLVSILVASLAALPALALDPICFPEEGYVITSNSEVEMEGDLFVEELYSQEVCCPEGQVTVTVMEDCCDEGDIVFQGPIDINAAFVGYREESQAQDGIVSLRKDFTALGQREDTADNVVVNKDVGYMATGPIGHYEAEEAGGLDVWQASGVSVTWDVTNNGVDEDIIVTARPDNQKERHVALGSDMYVTAISAHTDTDLNLFGNTITASHDISAVGEGAVGADLLTRYRELDMAEMEYTQHTRSDGVFTFNKMMDVRFDLEPPAADPFDTLTPLCPFNQPLEAVNLGAAVLPD